MLAVADLKSHITPVTSFHIFKLITDLVKTCCNSVL